MTNIWKRSLSLFLAFIMVFGMIPVNAFAVEEELVEEVLVEELVEEEIFEEEILEEELFEDEVFEEKEIEEEPAEVTVEEYHETDELANAGEMLKGTILVNGNNVMDEVEALLQDGEAIKAAVLNGLGITDDCTVEYPWTKLDEESGKTYSGVTDVTTEEFTDNEFGVWQILGDDLQEKILANEPKTAIFLVNGQEAEITFGDSRLNSIRISLAAFEIANKGEMKQSEVEAWIAEYIENNLKVTAFDPVAKTDVAVDLDECDIEIKYYDENGDYCGFQWPAVGESAECVEVLITVYNPEVFNQDKESEAKVAYVYGTLKDDNWYVTVNFDIDGEITPVTAVVGTDITDKVPAPTKEYYNLSWNPAIGENGVIADEDKTYTAVWTPKAGYNVNNNDTADPDEWYTVNFYDWDDEDAVYAEYAGEIWGKSFDELEPKNLTKDGANFAGWGTVNKRGQFKLTNLPDKVGPNTTSKTNDWTFFASWTQDKVVTFMNPERSVRSADGIEYNVPAEYVQVVDGETVAPIDVDVNILGWKVLGKTEAYDFTTAVTSNLTLIPMVDSNNNGVEDGTEADPIYTYIWLNNKGAEVEHSYLLGSEAVVAPAYPEQANDGTTFVEWNEPPETVGRVSTFKPVMAKDKNDNEVDDTKETVVVTVNGNGTVKIDGVEVVSGEGFVYNSKVNNVVKAIPAMNGEYTETYVSAFSLAGKSLDYAADCTVSCNLNGAEEVSVTFSAAIEAKQNPVMDTSAIAYDSKPVYDAVVNTPSSDNGEVTAYYLAREYDPAYAKINLNSLKGMFDSAVTRMLEIFDESEEELRAILDTKFESVTDNGYYSDFESGDAWIAVEEAGNVKGILNNGNVNTPQNAANEWIEATKQKAANDPIKYFGPYVDFESAQNTVDDLVDGLMAELQAALSGSNMHAFGENKTESVKVTYKDKTRYAASEAVTLELKETRIPTSITGSIAPVNYTGKALSEDALLANIKVDADNGQVFKAELNGVDASEFINAGTHTVPVKFEPEGAIDGITYKASYATFSLTINRADSNLSFGGNMLVAQGQEINPFPNVAKGAEYVHVIAGVEIDPAKVDLNEGELLGAVSAKAWIKIPASLKTMAEGMLDDLKTGSYSLTELTDMLKSYEELFAEVGADINDIIAKMDKANRMVEKINGIVSELMIDLEVVEGDNYGPKNIGVYMNMAIVTDSNYNRAKDDCIMLVHPGAMPSKNGFQIVNANGAANVFTSAGGLKVKLDGADVNVPIQYFGVSTTGNIIMSAETPTAAGMYIASAVYESDEFYTDAAVVVIAPKDSDVELTSSVVKAEDGKSFAPAIKATAGASLVKISASVDVPGKQAVVNIDMPAKAVKIVNALLGKVGEQMPKDITLSELITKLEAAPAAIKAKIPMEVLKDMGLDSISVGGNTKSIDDVIEVIEKTVEALVDPLKEAKAMLRGAEAVLTFEQNKKYSEPGVYFYAVAVIDPMFMPSFDAGYLVIESDTFAAEKKTITLKEAGENGYELKPTNAAGRGYITVINDGKGNWNLLLDGDVEMKVLNKLSKKFGKDLSKATTTVKELKEIAENWADANIAEKPWTTATAEVIVDSIREEALRKINDYVEKYLGSRTEPIAQKVINYLTGIVDERMPAVVNGLDKVLTAINAREDYTLSINAALPKTEGKYEFHFLSYAVAYETATLEIVDDLFRLAGASVVLKDNLRMDFAVMKSDLKGSTDYKAVITRTYANKDPQTLTLTYDQWIDKGSYLVFSYDGLAAKEMTDEIYITIYHGNGTPASYEWIDSLQLYADRGLNPAPGKEQPSEVLKRVYVDMLNYGTEAQKHFGYNTNDLADALLTAEQKNCASGDVTASDARVKGDMYIGTSVVTKSSLIMDLGFKKLDSAYTAYVSYTDHYGNPESLTIPGTEFVANSGNSVVRVTGLAIADGSCLVTCEIKDADGAVVASVQDSIESYVARTPDVVTAYRLLQLSKSAAEYFDSI